VNGFIVFARAERNPLLGSLAGQVVFGKIWPIDRTGFLVTYQSYGSALAFLAQHVHTRRASSMSTQDVPAAPAPIITTESGFCGQAYFKTNIPLSINSDLAVLVLDTAASERVECGSSFGLPRRKLNRAWCHGQRMVSPTTSPSDRDRCSACRSHR
jgi:hypothetical protein